ncbi:MAG: GntR family transcriptional regulator [Hyphomonadaceae bacterium JAD_PAG50586_4]|nr:MAG: GntR family transcriptional regulator [Hyphomonadaceae bacterium JAD_PAG50586_4]
MARPAEPTIPERAYQEIKRRMLDGTFRLRARLDASAIAQDLGISVTPVREALVRLAAERFVYVRPAKGFYVMLWSEAQLQDLYLWRSALVQLALEELETRPKLPSADGDYADWIGAVLGALHQGVNHEIVQASINAEERLRRARLAEPELWPDVQEETEGLIEVLESAPLAKAQKSVEAYHRRRAAHAKQIRDLAALRDLPANGG